MNFFTWKDNGLTSDCSSLDAMASRFEETANLMKKLSKKGFKLKKTQKPQDQGEELVDYFEFFLV